MEGPAGAQKFTFSVEVEQGLPIDKKVAADSIYQILNDPRGWGEGGKRSFTRTDANPQFRIVLGVTKAHRFSVRSPRYRRGIQL